jgi:hypothetical protein
MPNHASPGLSVEATGSLHVTVPDSNFPLDAPVVSPRNTGYQCREQRRLDVESGLTRHL